jgi:hypothetical protein
LDQQHLEPPDDGRQDDQPQGTASGHTTNGHPTARGRLDQSTKRRSTTEQPWA